MADFFDNATVEQLDNSDVEIITLKQDFQNLEVKSKVLYVRKCMRDIFDSINWFRKEPPKPNTTCNKNAAVIGQPGIGKSCSLYYFAYKFLEQDDVDLVVIQDDESNQLHVFCEGDLAGVHKYPMHNSVLDPLRKKMDLLGTRAVLLVDMNRKVNHNDRLSHSDGLTVFTSSPGPYKTWLEGMRQKLRLKVFSPPPLTKPETKALFDQLVSNGQQDQPEMTFDEYYDVFGGTIRPMMGAALEFDRMGRGSLKLLDIPPAKIVDMVRRVTDLEGEDYTNALFLDPGGREEDNYIVSYLSSRCYRSKFSEFWFRQHIAPLILFKSYTAEILSVLYSANQLANGGHRGCKFEDLFHKLLPLGNWATRDVPEEEQKGSPWHFLASYFGGWGGCHSKEDNPGQQLLLMNVPVVQRGADETDTVELDVRWNVKVGKKKHEQDSTTAEAEKEDNRRDVAKLIATCKEMKEFYWVPRGQHFPGIDSVHKNSSSLNFVKVKTGAVAEEGYRWINGAIHFSQLLFDLMPIENKEQLSVSILVGAEPAHRPILKKRKRQSLAIPQGWNIRYLSAPIADTIPQNLSLSMDMYQETLKAELSTFKVRQQILESSADSTKNTRAVSKAPREDN